MGNVKIVVSVQGVIGIKDLARAANYAKLASEEVIQVLIEEGVPLKVTVEGMNPEDDKVIQKAIEEAQKADRERRERKRREMRIRSEKNNKPKETPKPVVDDDMPEPSGDTPETSAVTVEEYTAPIEQAKKKGPNKGR